MNVASRPEPDASLNGQTAKDQTRPPNGQTARDQTRPRTGRLPGIRRDPQMGRLPGIRRVPERANGQGSDATLNGHGPKAAELLD